MDRLVVPGYSGLGYAARRSGWEGPAAGALDGRRVVVTGANSGLGKATVAGLVGLGAAVEMVVRDRDKGERARREVLADRPGAEVTVAVCDLSRLADVHRYADDVTARFPALDGLVHNAGVLPPHRQETDEGHELTLATHVLAPHLLTHRLRPLLRAAAGPATPSRVVFVSSGGMYTAALNTEDPEFRTGRYRGGAAYARTKRMQVVLAELLAEELAGDAVVVHSMHPGWADTPGVAGSMPGFRRITGPLLRTGEQGADTVVWLLAAREPGHCSGLFWHDRAPRPTHWPGLPLPGVLGGRRETPDARAALWALCVRATGVPSVPASPARGAEDPRDGTGRRGR